MRGLEPGQRRPGGHQCRAGRRPRQQRPHLGLVDRVVQHDQDPPVRQQVAVEVDPVVHGGRNRPTGHAEPAQQPVQGGGGFDGLLLAATQVQVELPVRKRVPHDVRAVHSERSLAHSTGTRDRPGPAGPQPRREPLNLVGAAGEVAHGGGQPGRPCLDRDRRGRPGQNLHVQSAELGVGVDPELVGQHLARPPEHVECLGLLPGPVQRQHQLVPEPFAQRMLGDQRAQLVDDLVVPPQLELGVVAPLQHLPALLVQPLHVGLFHPQRRHLVQRGAPPQRGGLAQQPGLGLQVGRAAGLGAQALERQQVELVVVEVDRVAGRPGADELPVRQVVERLAQPHDVRLQGRARGTGRLLTPEVLHQLVRRDRRVRLHQQRGKQDTLFGRPQLHDPARVDDLQRSENLEPPPPLHAPILTSR